MRTMRNFDGTIRQAVLRACEIAGSQKAFAEATGISPQNISKYLQGRVRSISPKVWKTLFPHIKPYLAGTTAETLCHDSTGDGSMSEDDFQLNTLHLLDALIVTLNFRPKIECPPELQGRLKQLQIAIGRHFCAAGERGADDCAWNCRYAGTEKCNSKCRYSSIGDSGVSGSEAAGAADSTGEEAQP